jgi:hypothetical protein
MEQYRKNMGDILEINLAIESYRDDTQTEYSDEEKKIEADLQLLREQRNDLTETEKAKRSEDILARLNKVLDEIGREKFIFHTDGEINYIYKNV